MRLWPQYRLVVHLRDGVCKPLVHLQEGELFILRPLIRPGFGVHRPLPVIAGAAFQQRSPRFQRGTCTFRSCKQRLLVHYHTDPLNKTVVSTNMWVQPDAFFDAILHACLGHREAEAADVKVVGPGVCHCERKNDPVAVATLCPQPPNIIFSSVLLLRWLCCNNYNT